MILINRYENETDVKLVELSLDGDADAFEKIVVRYQRLVFAAVREIVSDAFAVEDIAQDTFVDAFMKLSSLREAEKLRSWLVGIARRKSLKYVTRKRQFYDIENIAASVLSDDDPELSFLRHEKNSEVRHAVLTLPEKARQVAVMFYFHDMKVADIARTLSVPVSTVTRRLHDARAKLKERLCYMEEKINNTIPAGFADEVKKRLLEMQTYYVEKGFKKDDNIKKMLDDAEKYINAAPSENEKKRALADLYTFWGISEKKEEGLALAKESGNGKVIADKMIDELLAHSNYDEWLRRIDEEMIPEMERLGCDEGKGELLFWKARAMFAKRAPIDELERVFAEAARLIPPENVYQACAVCGLRSIRFMREQADDPYLGFHVTSEQYRISGSKLLFISQPGWSEEQVAWSSHQWDAITFFATREGRVFYDTSMKPGDIITSDSDSTLLLVSSDEALIVPAGNFTKCMHISLRSGERGYFPVSAEVWYAEGVGLVKAVFSNGSHSETYELSEYDIKGGEGYFPLAVGNTWRFVNPELPEYVASFYEWYVTWSDGVSANLSTATVVAKKKEFDEERDADSEYFVDKCGRLCSEASTDVDKVYEAIEALRCALRKNTSERDAQTALFGIEYLENFAECMKKYRICPSSFNTYILSRKNGRVATKEYLYSLGPYRWGTHHGEDGIFGAKPLRYQEVFLNCIWDDKWTVGYHEENGERQHPYKREEEVLHPFSFTVTDGGTITVPAGTFENCIKLTLEYGTPDDVPKADFSGTGGSAMGKKEYYLARGVGIVRFDCDWNNLKSSLCLTSYKNPAHDDSYFPLAIGCEWEYDEAVLTSLGYCAKRVTKIPCGHDGNYLVQDSQEFYYRGSEEEYTAFVKELYK